VSSQRIRGFFYFVTMELIKITEQNGSQVVNARDLHAFLIQEAKGGQTGEDFSHWIKRTLSYGFLESVDYEILEYDYLGNLIAKNSESDNQQVRVYKRDFALTIDCAKQIAMIQNNDKGKEARLYFIECERKTKQSQSPTTFLEALKIAVKLEEEKQALLLQADNLNTALDNLLEWVSIIKVAQHNRVSETVFKWQLLKSTSAQMGYQVKKAESPRFGYQNLYNVAVFRRCYPQYNYNFKIE
jgi:anti-repressor protein